MASLPYMQFFVAHYLGDTQHLATEEHGAYLLLLFNYWQRGKPFTAPDEQMLNERLANVVRLSIDRWNEIRPVIAEFFVVSPTEWRHNRVDADLLAAKEKSDKAKAAGNASAERRQGKRPADAKRPSNDKDKDIDKLIKDNIPYAEILAFLNTACKTNYKLADGLIKHINARFADGYTLADFQTVITKKAKEWLGNKEMAKYLRPDTLFGTKFQIYLNQPEGGGDNGPTSGDNGPGNGPAAPGAKPSRARHSSGGPGTMPG